MAQAARLSLRMQKELKLLLTDPPPGASFPCLSADSDVSSLSTIDAQIEGPEGTVYAKGIFNIKIQIPERYPFQPPMVTFATPIYHPNIDNGGRICLDILNLPPKGAWQPSLNISTVLTSIGLLLSEPNPDDGLMCEASKEYKYNRQAFDQKARSMTEKYAKAGGHGNSSSSGCTETDPNTNKIKGLDKESKGEANEFVSSHNKPFRIRKKLSLDSSSLTQKGESNREANDEPSDHSFLFNFELKIEANRKRKEVKCVLDDYNLSHDKPQGTKRRLSLACFGQFQKRDGNDKEDGLLNQSQSHCEPKLVSITYSESGELQSSISNDCQGYQNRNNQSANGSANVSALLPQDKQEPVGALEACQVNDEGNLKTPVTSQALPAPFSSHAADCASLSANHNEQWPQKDSIDSMGKKLGSASEKFLLGSKGSSQKQEEDNKENLMLVNKLALSNSQNASKTSGSSRKLSLGPLSLLQAGNNDNSQLPSHSGSPSTGPSKPSLVQQHHEGSEKEQTTQEQDVKFPGGLKRQNTEESLISEAIVVLDSEDSEDEGKGSFRSKLSIARRRTGRKAKA